MQIETNKKYWLCLEPTTFIFDGTQEFVLYNSLSKKMLRYETRKDDNVIATLKLFLDMDNMYSLLLDGNDIKNKGLIPFIHALRDGYFGDLFLEEWFSQRPIVFPPIANVKNCIGNLEKDPELYSRQSVLQFLHEITIYLNGNCNLSCEHCDGYKQQFTFCTKGCKQFSFYDLTSIIELVKDTFITRINLIGGNIFNYSHFDDLIFMLSHTNTQCYVYTHYLNAKEEVLQHLLVKDIAICLLIPPPYDHNTINRLSKLSSNYKELITWIFIIESEEDLNAVQMLQQQTRLDKVSIKPYYNGKNLDFFKENVYTTTDDIENNRLDSQDVFARQNINLHNYGKLIITPDLQIFTSFNSINHHLFDKDFFQIVKKELNPESLWFNTRDKSDDCCDCAFRFLCPSPSGYEQVIGVSNLCKIYS